MPAVTLQSSTNALAVGETTELTWTTQNVTKCTAGGGWEGEQSLGMGHELAPVYRDTEFTLTCANDDGAAASAGVDIGINSGRLQATVTVNPSPVRGGERVLAEVVVSNPSTEIAEDVVIVVLIPELVEPLDPSDLSPGGTCTGDCGVGQMVTWEIGVLDVGRSIAVTLAPTVSLDFSEGDTLDFPVTVTAAGEEPIQKTGSVEEGQRVMALAVDEAAGPVVPGDELVYSLKFANDSGTALENVVVLLVVPPGTSFASASDDGELTNDGAVEWLFEELAADAAGILQAIVEVSGVLPPGAQLGAESSANVGNERTIATTHVSVSEGSLTTSVRVSPQRVFQNERFAVEITVSNRGSEEATGVSMELPFPPQLQALAEDLISGGGGCVNTACEAGETVVWNLDAIQAGESVTVSLPPGVEAVAPIGTTIAFEPKVRVGGELVVEAVAAATVVQARNIEFRLTESANPVAPDTELTYTLYATNTGDTTANGSLTVAVPKRTTFVRASGGVSPDSSRTVRWPIAGLGAGQGTTRQLTVTVDDDVAHGTLLRGDASVAIVGEALETRATTSTRVGARELVARVEASPDPMKNGDRLAAAVTVSNATAADIDGVLVQLRYPPQGAALSELLFDGNCINTACEAGELVTWDLGTMPAGASTTLQVPATLGNFADGTSVPLDFVVDRNEGGPTNSRAVVILDRRRPMEVRLVADPRIAPTGSLVRYTAHFANESGAPVNGSLTMSVPTGTRFIEASDDGKLNAEGEVQWPFSQLPDSAGGTRWMRLRVNAGRANGSQVQVQATVDTGVGDGDESRASANVVIGDAPLIATVDLNRDPVIPGSRLVAGITVSNRSGGPIDGIVVNLRYPEEATALSELLFDGNCTNTACEAGEPVIWNVGTLPNGGSTTLAIPPEFGDTIASGQIVPMNVQVSGDGISTVEAGSAAIVNAARPIELELAPSRNPVRPGELLDYVIHFGNDSGDVLDGTLELTVPEGSVFIAASHGGEPNLAGNVEWDIQDLGVGEGGSRTMTVLAPVTLVAGSQLVNEAEARVGPGDANRTRSESTVRVSPVDESSLLTTVEIGTDPGRTNARLPTAIVISNRRSATIENVFVDARFPEQMDALSELLFLGQCVNTACEAGELATWSLGTLLGGQTAAVTLPAVVSGNSTQGRLIPIDVVTRGDGVRPTISAATAIVDSMRPLTLHVDETRQPVAPSDNIVYTVHLGNRSGGDLSGTLTLAFSSEASFMSASDGGVPNADGDVQWSINSLQDGEVQSRQVTLAASGLTQSSGQIEVRAEAVVGNEDGASVRGTAQTPVSNEDLSLAVATSAGPVQPNGAFTVDATLTNDAGAAVTGVTVTVLIPFGVKTIAEADLLPLGGGCTNTSCEAGERITWTFTSIAAGDSVTVSVPAEVAAATPGGSVLTFESDVLIGVNPHISASDSIGVCSGAGCPP